MTVYYYYSKVSAAKAATGFRWNHPSAASARAKKIRDRIKTIEKKKERERAKPGRVRGSVAVVVTIIRRPNKYPEATSVE
jgi:hypothetical protein